MTVPEPTALIAQTGVALRRGPTTGLNYLPTADPRFNRTERLRLEIPRPSAAGTLSARLLGRDGQPLNLTITLTDSTDPNKPNMIVANLALAPLAQGEYRDRSHGGSGRQEGKCDLRLQAGALNPIHAVPL